MRIEKCPRCGKDCNVETHHTATESFQAIKCTNHNIAIITEIKKEIKRTREFETISNLSYSDLDPTMSDSFEGDY